MELFAREVMPALRDVNVDEPAEAPEPTRALLVHHGGARSPLPPQWERVG
jgi:hypothetical protein